MKRFVIISLLLAVAWASFAQAPADRSEVRKGNRHFRKENYKEAEIDYRRALVKDSTSVAGNYNLANTLYRMENYQEAAKYAENAENAACESGSACAADVHFNKGDIALQNKDYNTAVEAFKRSLLLNPGDVKAKENYIYARKMLENQQQNGGGGGNDQNQNNDQNQDQQNQNNDQNQQNQDQNKDQNKDQQNDQNQNKDQNSDRNQDKQGENQQPQMTPQAAQQMLQAIEAKEKETQEKVKKEKALQAKSRQRDKNW